MSEVIVYHYTPITDAGTILGNSGGLDRTSGLEPRTEIGIRRASDPASYASFALLEPTPKNWTDNPDIPGVWNFLKMKLRARAHTVVLLEISLNMLQDTVRVGDRAHMEGHYLLQAYRERIPSHFQHEDKLEAIREYLNTEVTLEEYLQKQRRGEARHSLPEVLIFNYIPPEKIRVSEWQPMLENDLNSFKNWEGIRDQIVLSIIQGNISNELMSWRTQYERQNGPLEISGRGKETL